MSGSNFTEHHVATPVNYGGIPARAAALLEQAAVCIRERGASYNKNGFDYEDYNNAVIMAPDKQMPLNEYMKGK